MYGAKEIEAIGASGEALASRNGIEKLYASVDKVIMSIALAYRAGARRMVSHWGKW